MSAQFDFQPAGIWLEPPAALEQHAAVTVTRLLDAMPLDHSPLHSVEATAAEAIAAAAAAHCRCWGRARGDTTGVHAGEAVSVHPKRPHHHG
ncbi:unnamed protein product [Phytophthora fragariaefolia]|uniref:Unnamed protein product n=1 Tax=Phytophthora fragariaefolia TaxID=1490495 RepID=A0A9W7CWQ0_9STRA|nr:unnamed protein product [Phytophthora fragariaefolia]